jgi:chitin synthase
VQSSEDLTPLPFFTMANRMSMYSMASEGIGGPRAGGPQTAQVSTTTLLNAVHNIYLNGQAHGLDASTSLVVNTWLTAARSGGTVDASLASRAFEHARRRAEDGCIILGYAEVHPSCDCF